MFGYSPPLRKAASAGTDIPQPMVVNDDNIIHFTDIVQDTGGFFDADGTTIHLAAHIGHILMCSIGVAGVFSTTLITDAWIIVASPNLATRWTNDAIRIEPSWIWTGRIEMYLPPQARNTDISFFAHIDVNEAPTQRQEGSVSVITV